MAKQIGGEEGGGGGGGGGGFISAIVPRKTGSKIGIVVALIVIAIIYFEFAPAEKKDFFECGANNTLVACPVGETPDADTHGDCRAVGDGDTTIDDGTCS